MLLISNVKTFFFFLSKSQFLMVIIFSQSDFDDVLRIKYYIKKCIFILKSFSQKGQEIHTHVSNEMCNC